MITIAECQRRLTEIRTPSFFERAMTVIGFEIVRQIGVGFETSSDPYGNFWKARKQEKPWPLLEKTGHMRGSAQVASVSPNHVYVVMADGKAAFHQYGTAKMVARRMIPVATRGLGVWGPRIGYLMGEQVKRALNG